MGTSYRSFIENNKKSARQKGQCWVHGKMPEACVQNSGSAFYIPDIISLCILRKDVSLLKILKGLLNDNKGLNMKKGTVLAA